MATVSQTNVNALVDTTIQANYENIFNRAFRRQAFAADSNTDNLDYEYHADGPVSDNTFHRADSDNQTCIILLSGPPGSGKTTWANAHFSNVFSADDYMIDENGEYIFNRHRIGEVHRRCEDELMEALDENKCVVYCNTNTQLSDFRNIIFKLRRRFELDETFSCMVYPTKMADVDVETLVERVSVDGNGHGVEEYKLHNSRNRWNWLFNTFNPKYISWCRITGYVVPTHRILQANRCFHFPGPYMPAPNANPVGSDITSDFSEPSNNRTHFHHRYYNQNQNDGYRRGGRGRGQGRGRGRGYARNFNRDNRNNN